MTANLIRDNEISKLFIKPIVYVIEKIKIWFLEE